MFVYLLHVSIIPFRIQLRYHTDFRSNTVQSHTETAKARKYLSSPVVNIVHVTETAVVVLRLTYQVYSEMHQYSWVACSILIVRTL